jgi:hypothetical protein
MPIVSVVVYNRPDECGERLFGAQLLVLDQDRLELSSFELTEDRRQEFALMMPWRHIDAERRLGDVPRCSPRLEQHILLAGATPNVYLMLDLCCQDPLGVFMRGLRSQTIVNGRRYEPHITLMPLRLAPHDASKLRDDDTFACEVRRLFTEHLRGATARAKGWGIFGPNRYLALQFELVLRCCITEFRIGVYRALGVLLSAGGGAWRFGYDGVTASPDGEWQLLRASDGRLAAAVPTYAYGRGNYVPHCTLCKERDVVEASNFLRMNSLNIPPSVSTWSLGGSLTISARSV